MRWILEERNKRLRVTCHSTWLSEKYKSFLSSCTPWLDFIVENFKILVIRKRNNHKSKNRNILVFNDNIDQIIMSHGSEDQENFNRHRISQLTIMKSVDEAISWSYRTRSLTTLLYVTMGIFVRVQYHLVAERGYYYTQHIITFYTSILQERYQYDFFHIIFNMRFKETNWILPFPRWYVWLIHVDVTSSNNMFSPIHHWFSSIHLNKSDDLSLDTLLSKFDKSR